MKTIVITGASRGIGREIALRMAGLGHGVVLNYSTDAAAAEEAVTACRRISEAVLLVKADVSRADGVEHLLRRSLERFDGVDVLINNASINIDRPLFEMSEDDWDRVVDVDMKSVFLTARALGAVMMQKRSGHIINLGATTAITGRANGLNYCAAKAGVLVMTKCLAIELAPHVRVNCVIPGTIRTPEIEQRFDLAANEQEMSERILMRRIGEPRDVADAIEFLISDQAGYITGQKLIIDGGSFLY